MNEKVLVFTGAGMGVPLGLPVSTGFVDEIAQRQVPITTALIKFLGEEASSDIEQLLAKLVSFDSEAEFLDDLIPGLAHAHPQVDTVTPHLRMKLKASNTRLSGASCSVSKARSVPDS